MLHPQGPPASLALKSKLGLLCHPNTQEGKTEFLLQHPGATSQMLRNPDVDLGVKNLTQQRT